MLRKEHKNALKFLRQNLKWHHSIFYMLIISTIMSSTFSVVMPILAKIETDQLVEKNNNLFEIIYADPFYIFTMILLLILIAEIINQILSWIISNIESNRMDIYRNKHSIQIHKRVQKTEIWNFLNSRTKRFIKEIDQGSELIWDIQEFISWAIWQSIKIVWVLFVVAYLDWKIIIVILISIVLNYFIDKFKNFLWASKSIYDLKQRRKLAIYSREMTSNTTNLISNWWFEKIIAFFEKTNQEILEYENKHRLKSIFLNIWKSFIDNISSIVVKILIGYSIFYAGMSVGVMIMIIMYTSNIKYSIEGFVSSYLSMFNFLDKLLKLDLFLKITQADEDKNIENIGKIEKIEFQDTKFKYPNFAEQELKYLEIQENAVNRFKNRYNKDNYEKEMAIIKKARKEINFESPEILKWVNATFQVGKTYWIVGKNWAGKTTMANLIQWFFNTYKWDIKINGADAKKVKRERFEKNISIINQVPYVIEGLSIRDNIMLGVEKKYTDDQILQVLEQVRLRKKIESAFEWIDTELWYSIEFSGGEKQLLALARIILQDKKIIIMDEWTNQLDAENEKKIMQQILNKSQEKIIVFISHRMTSIRKIDLIYCLENGKIIAQWNHASLMQTNNPYSKFWKQQVEE